MKKLLIISLLISYVIGSEYTIYDFINSVPVKIEQGEVIRDNYFPKSEEFMVDKSDPNYIYYYDMFDFIQAKELFQVSTDDGRIEFISSDQLLKLRN